MSNSQHRRVFVGNIPYDVSEEQIIQICEEVGPVVSFRLVTDRETGKPKGYGFCEYKDEETALSARRNLMGYEINGRQLRVDFAESDKVVDRNREQGHGGSGIVANAVFQKVSKGVSDYSLQPVGLPLAMAAASVMAGAVGDAQACSISNQSRLSNQLGLGTDPLTLHLAKMSRTQLNEIMSELKRMATENMDFARRLLLSNPQLLKAIFQSEIMLQMVSPEILQMPNICRASSAAHSRNNLQFGFNPKKPEQIFEMHAMSQSSSLPNPVAPHAPSHNQIQVQLHGHMPISTQAASQHQIQNQVQVQLPSHISVRPPKIQMANPSFLKQYRFQESGVPVGGMYNEMPISSAVSEPSVPCPLPSREFEPLTVKKESDDAMMIPPSKYLKLGDGSYSASRMEMPSNEVHCHPAKQPQQGAPEIESDLLQQVLKLTPEQLGSLPPEQRRQVMQLQQQMLH